MSGKYGDCGITIVLFIAKNSRISSEVRASALSWCKTIFQEKKNQLLEVAPHPSPYTLRSSK